MATNPMQRKARNSFLLGMLVMLLIAGVVIALLFMQLMKKNKKEQEELQQSVKVYVLNKDVSSGQKITTDMLVQRTVNKSLVPSNATGDISSLVEQEIVAKVSMKANTVITSELVSKSDNVITNDVRREEYNMFVLPMDLQTGDYVDVRIMFPSGQNYIVVSKKEVEIPVIGGINSDDTIWMNLSEDEILNISSAIVEAYQVKGSKVYVTKYTDPGMQEAATPTYPANADVMKLIEQNPNIVEDAKRDLVNRYNVDIRNNYINSQVNSAGNEGKTNLQTKMDESSTNSKSTRKEYLDSLSGATIEE